jgi:hypothetical protein
MSWTENGPISLPPQPVAYFAGAMVVAAAIVGIGLGFRASWRNGDRPSLESADASQGVDAAIPAQPIVEIPALQQQAAASNAAAANSADDQSEVADSNAIAAQTAAAQADQSKSSRSSDDNDDALASSTEKPQAAVKPSIDEDAPGAPTKGKTDVPF